MTISSIKDVLQLIVAFLLMNFVNRCIILNACIRVESRGQKLEARSERIKSQKVRKASQIRSKTTAFSTLFACVTKGELL